MAQINKSTEYFNTVLYTGNGSTQSITGVNFQPDFTWIKNRDRTDYHTLVDAVRGAPKEIYTNINYAEYSNPNGLTAFNSDGFSVGSANDVNFNGSNLVAWNWLAGGTGVSNTDGSVTSTVSANTTSGFSIVKFTSGASAGFSVGHGLGTTPSVIIQKTTNSTGGWLFCHKDMSASGITSGYLQLQTTDAFTSNANVFTNVNNSTVTQGSVISNNYEQIMYCFAEKKGFSKFGSYTGNGIDTNGTFVYTGFKPAFIITKNLISTTAHWLMQTADGLNTYNPVKYGQLRPNLSNAEITAYTTDFLSNGFKFYNDTNQANDAGNTYIYMAFAENPLVGTNNIPITAR